MDGLPVTEAMPPRPVWARWTAIANGAPEWPPTEEEKRDAIRVLEEVCIADRHGLHFWPERLHVEAFRIMDLAGR